MEEQPTLPASRINGSDKAQAIWAKIHDGTNSLFTEMKGCNSERVLTYLAFMSKFHRYSFNNQMSIFMQLHTATRVNSLKRWNELGYTVAKGQIALYILAPRTYKKINEETQLEETRIYFTGVPVFDVSQLAEIAEKPFPEFFTPLADDQKALVRRVEEVIQAAGIRLRDSLNLDGTQGHSSHGYIAVKYGIDSRQRFLTLIHEFAHELLHWDEFGKKLPYPVKEHHAESVSYIVAHWYGIHNPFSADYLRSWDATLDDLRKELGVIQKTSHRIIELIDGTADGSGTHLVEVLVAGETGVVQEVGGVDALVAVVTGVSLVADSPAPAGRYSVSISDFSFIENYEETDGWGPSRVGTDLSDAAWELTVLDEWYREERLKCWENHPPQRTVEDSMDGAQRTPIAADHVFLLQQMDRFPLGAIQKRKHIAWCRRECRRLGMSCPLSFIVAHGSGDSDDLIIGDYHPSQPEAIDLTARRRLEASTDLFEDEVNEVEDEEQEEHLAGIWQDGDESETSPWLTVDEGLLIGNDGAIVAGFVPMPQVPEPTAGISGVGTADEFSAEMAFAEVRALQGRAMALLDGDDASDNPSVVLAAIREARQCIALASRLAGILDGD